MRRIGVIVLAGVLLVVAGCVAGTGQPTTVGPASPAVARSTTTTIEVGDRPVLLHVPASRPVGVPAALVVVLHGYTGEAEGAVEFFGLRQLADQRGFLVAAPQGTTDSEGKTFWNASNACCNFGGSTVDDSGYLSRVIATAVSTQGVDPARVYVVGHSNGGFMAHRLACEHADQVSAIASLAGALDAEADCTPARPVSVVQIHGTADDTIRYGGGAIEGRPYTSAAGTVGLWRRADGCRSDGRTGQRLDADANVAGDDLRATTWTTCREDTEVALWSITDGSHSPALTPAFTAALFDWFEAHRRTR
ncbi:MAG TPA: alpha/beta fold hydrolase [Propionicimonas sp.]|nr:alpha/beta fold hydrolase [Propionicimonas sp.]